MTQQFLLRMEGVNLDAVMSDTDQISVIRGSSLLLRAAVKDLTAKQDFESFTGILETISKGASVGLFRGTLSVSASAEDTATEVGQWLSTHPDYSHLTFVVDAVVVSEGGSFQQLREQLIAKNRIRQLQQVSLAIPGWNESGRVYACAFDGVRPATKPFTKGERSLSVSSSFYQRFEYGKRQRTQFYEDETGLRVDVTDDLKALADAPEQGNLHNKIAVIYFDGNRFGSIQKDHCTSIESQQKFDDYIQQVRRNFLTKLIEYAEQDADFQTEDEELRLEVLMWGGDEVLLVVPAWKGFDVIELFYRCTADAQYENSALTHAGGIVFSQANTPIYRLRALAESLANEVKAVIKQPDSPYKVQNAFDYLVLESMDFPVESLSTLRERQYAHQAGQRMGLEAFSAEALNNVRTTLQKGLLPRSQLVGLCFSAVNETPEKTDGDSEAKELEWRQKLARIQAVVSADIEQGKQQVVEIDQMLQQLFSNQAAPWQWLHLAELWDYLLPTSSLAAQTEEVQLNVA